MQHDDVFAAVEELIVGLLERARDAASRAFGLGIDADNEMH
jgi:hypothetical protein